MGPPPRPVHVGIGSRSQFTLPAQAAGEWQAPLTGSSDHSSGSGRAEGPWSVPVSQQDSGRLPEAPPRCSHQCGTAHMTDPGPCLPCGPWTAFPLPPVTQTHPWHPAPDGRAGRPQGSAGQWSPGVPARADRARAASVRQDLHTAHAVTHTWGCPWSRCRHFQSLGLPTAGGLSNSPLHCSIVWFSDGDQGAAKCPPVCPTC